MKRYLFLLFVLFVGCSVPDDDNWKGLGDGLEHLPPMTKTQAKRWTANRNASRKLSGIDRAAKAFMLKCEENVLNPVADPSKAQYDPNGNYAQKYWVTVGDLLNCLDADGTSMTLVECANKIIKDLEDSFRANTGLTPDCVTHMEGWLEAIGWLTGFGLDLIGTKVDEFDPDKIDFPEETERELVRSPRIPFWLLGVITVGVGGVVVVTGGSGAPLIPLLCTLSEGGPACPSNPNYPFGHTPQPGDK